MPTMSARHRTSAAVALAVALLVAGVVSVGGQRALSTPAERLVGHWVTDGGATYFYGPIGDKGRGSFILHEPPRAPFSHEYRLVK